MWPLNKVEIRVLIWSSDVLRSHRKRHYKNLLNSGLKISPLFTFFRQEKALCANMNRCFKSLAGTSANRSVAKVVQLQRTDFWYWICCSADVKQFLSQNPNQVGVSNKTEQHQTKMNTWHIYHNSMFVSYHWASNSYWTLWALCYTGPRCNLWRQTQTKPESVLKDLKWRQCISPMWRNGSYLNVKTVRAMLDHTSWTFMASCGQVYVSRVKES